RPAGADGRGPEPLPVAGGVLAQVAGPLAGRERGQAGSQRHARAAAGLGGGGDRLLDRVAARAGQADAEHRPRLRQGATRAAASVLWLARTRAGVVQGRRAAARAADVITRS